MYLGTFVPLSVCSVQALCLPGRGALGAGPEPWDASCPPVAWSLALKCVLFLISRAGFLSPGPFDPSGLDHSVFWSIPGLSLLGVRSTLTAPNPSCDNQKYLQTLPNVANIVPTG